MADYPYSESGSFRVRPYRPGRTIALMGVLAVGAIFGGWSLYELGRTHGGADQRMSQATEARLRIQIEDLRERVSELVHERALLERSRSIDESAFDRLEGQLERREQHIGHLEEELAFYRSLVSSADAETQTGMNVERFSLFDQGDGEYRYELVLTRLDHDDTEATGHVDLEIEGAKDGASVRIAWADVIVDESASNDFDFKYFQALSGRVRLPDGVDPETVHVRVRPDDNDIDEVDEEFAWDSLTSGGS